MKYLQLCHLVSLSNLATSEFKVDISEGAGMTMLIKMIVMAPSLSMVSVKLPSFWTLNSDVWFQQAAAQFALCNITSSEVRYFYMVSVLDAARLVCVSPFLLNFHTPYSYAELKTLLINIYGLSNDERACSFSNINDMGDRCRSEVIEQIFLLHGHEELNFLLLYAFKRLMPPPVCQALLALSSTKPRTWAKEADCLMVDHEEQFPVTMDAQAPSPAHSLPLPHVEVSHVLAATAPSDLFRR